MGDGKNNIVTVNFDEFEMAALNASNMWVFGYGSLMWKPGFLFEKSEIGYITGYARRMWQGNCNHRGTDEHPGRVAMLISDEKSRTWGVAFKLVGQEQISAGLMHLGTRECRLGGYQVEFCTFYGRNSEFTTSVVLFNATIDNPQYLGDAPLEQMAKEIVYARGRCGFNSEYVTRIAQYVKDNIPEDDDMHLFKLDGLIKEILAENGIVWTEQWKTITFTCPSVQALLNDKLEPFKVVRRASLTTNNNNNFSVTNDNVSPTRSPIEITLKVPSPSS